MKLHTLVIGLIGMGFFLTGPAISAQTSALPSWIDPDTGHRVIQLSTVPGSESLYFNLNPFTPDGKRMVFTTPKGISLINLQTGEQESVVAGNVHIIMVGHKTGQIYYTTSDRNNPTVMAVDPITKQTHLVAKLTRGESVSAVNADETLLAGTIMERSEGVTNRPSFAGATNASTNVKLQDIDRSTKALRIQQRFDEHDTMELFFLNIQTGEVKTYDRCTDWLNHLQFSPTNPTLLLFCHEGPWHKVDRIWTIRTDGTQLTKVHQRTMAMEIAGHEFFSADGKTVWYDLQTPRGEDFWVAGYEVATGKRTWYHL